MLCGIIKLRTKSISGIEENYDVGLDLQHLLSQRRGDYFTFKFLEFLGSKFWSQKRPWVLTTRAAYFNYWGLGSYTHFILRKRNWMQR